MDSSNLRLYEHGICIRHCQGSNPQPVPSQAHADPTRPQFRLDFNQMLRGSMLIVVSFVETHTV